MGADRIVVTGAAGFIGSHLCEALLGLGHDVIGIDAVTSYYARTDKLDNLRKLRQAPAFRFVEGDLAHLDLVRWLAGARVVFHQAGQPGVRASWGPGFAEYVHHNLVATQRLLEACVSARVPRLVAASSSSVYGNAPTYPTTETAPTRPVSPYGVTKLASEQLCLAYAQPGICDIAVATLRYFTVYGPRQRPDMAFRRFFEAAYTGQPITIYGDGEQTRDFTYVDDAVRANLLAMRAPLTAETVNIGGGRRVTLNEVLEQIQQVTGRRLHIRRGPAQPGDARHTGADGAKAEAVLGYRPQIQLEAGLGRQAAWVAARHDPASEAGPSPAPDPADAGLLGPLTRGRDPERVR